jgi:glyoxylase-like metal-dependent hydrolase (beta-lactamase superfamily II)
MLDRIALIVWLICLVSSCTPLPKAQNDTHWYDSMPRASWSKYQLIDTKQDWFEVYQLNTNTYAIYEPNQWQEAISYLLIGSEKAMLVDTLQGIGDLKSLVAQLTNLPLLVINTHSHFDHVSGNYQFDTIYGVNNTFALNNAKGHDNAVNGQEMTADTFWKNLPPEFSMESYENKPYQIDYYVADGEIIELGERPIEVVFIPGHSPDSIMLIDKNNRLMLTGDSFYPAPLYLYSETSSFRDFANSVKTMLSYQDRVDFLLPGHNETMQSVAYLAKLQAAVLAVQDAAVPSKLEDEDVRNYEFEGFSLLVKDPLDK